MAEFPVAIITDEFTQDFEHICESAVNLGIPALELRTAWNKNVVDMSDGQIADIRDFAQSSNLRIVSIASPVFKCTHPAGGDIDHRFEQDAFHAAHTFEDQRRILNRSLEIANELGASIVRVFSFWRTTEPANLTGAIIESLTQAADLAAERKIIIGIENEHACNLATAAEVAPVLNAVKHPNLGLVWDPANAYVAGESPFPEGYSLLPADRIVHVHAKDGIMAAATNRMQWGDVGKGDVDWKGQLSALVRDGYHGMVSLETHWGGPEGNKFEGSVICAKSLKRLVAEAA